ncbi:MAG: hypothetical protein PHF79_01090 [Candidatus Pacebacteria bacterium]|nr:hypothetical protein [Candidatus Paceibacterota bacterium]
MPEEIKKYLESANYIIAIQEIGADFDLMINKIDSLEQETRALISGKIFSADFTQKIRDVLEIPEGEAEKIAAEIDEKILKPLKHTLVEMGGEESEHKDLNKEDVLNEIENPTPTPKNSSLPTANASAVRPPNTPTTISGTTPMTSIRNQSLTVQKMAETIQVPKKEIVINEKSSPSPAVPSEAPQAETKKYAVDPYREQF